MSSHQVALILTDGYIGTSSVSKHKDPSSIPSTHIKIWEWWYAYNPSAGEAEASLAK